MSVATATKATTRAAWAAWGVDYLKYDYCGARGIYPLTRKNQQALFQAMGTALREAGRPSDGVQPFAIERFRHLAMGQADRCPYVAHYAGQAVIPRHGVILLRASRK